MKLLTVVLMLGLAGSTACSDDSPGPMAPNSMTPIAPVVSNPKVIVNGNVVQGRVNSGNGEPSLFQIRVVAPQGLSTVARVVMQYAQPGPNHHGGPMSGGFRGTVLCYDDGTNGDDVAGDGLYHYFDPQSRIGCHGIGAPRGDYEYHFWCEDIFGQSSNTETVTITRE